MSILGHAFSPFLGFKGGKAIATSLGMWNGLTLWKASLPGAIMALIGVALFTSSGWSVMLALVGIMIILLIWLPVQLLIMVWLAEVFLLIWTLRTDLRHSP